MEEEEERIWEKTEERYKIVSSRFHGHYNHEQTEAVATWTKEGMKEEEMGRNKSRMGKDKL